jgi:hypothetical protein
MLIAGRYPCSFRNALSFRKTALSQQKTPKSSKIVQNAPAGSDVQVQLGKIEGDQEKCFFAPFSALALSRGNFGIYITTGFVKSFSEQSNILVRPLDTVKWRFGLVAQKHAFPTSLFAVGPTKN